MDNKTGDEAEYVAGEEGQVRFTIARTGSGPRIDISDDEPGVFLHGITDDGKPAVARYHKGRWD
jgi:hypothetical protein